MRKKLAPFAGLVLSAALMSPASALAQVKGAAVECVASDTAPVVAAAVTTPTQACITIDDPVIVFTGDVAAKSNPTIYQMGNAKSYTFGKIPNLSSTQALAVVGCSSAEQCSDNLAIKLLRASYVKSNEIVAESSDGKMLFNLSRDEKTKKETITGQLTISEQTRAEIKQLLKDGTFGENAKGCITNITGMVSVMPLRKPIDEPSQFEEKLQAIVDNKSASDEERSDALDALEAAKTERARIADATPRGKVSDGRIYITFDGSSSIMSLSF